MVRVGTYAFGTWQDLKKTWELEVNTLGEIWLIAYLEMPGDEIRQEKNE